MVGLKCLPLLVLLFNTAAVHARSTSRNVLELGDRARARLSERDKQRAIQKYGLKTVALRPSFLKQHKPTYKCEIPRERQPHEIRDQQASGRCWIYAADNVLQAKLHQKGINPGDLSASFINYYSLLTRATYMIQMGALSRKPPELRRSQVLGEGGWQPWATAIIRHYGIVPEKKMPTTADGANSAMFRTQLQALVASAYRDMRRVADGADARQQRIGIANHYSEQVERLLQTTLGKPPKRFTIAGKTYTPQQYATEALGLTEAELDYVVLSHDPTSAWNRRYRYRNSVGMPGFDVYNVSMKDLEGAVKQTLDKGEAVWFGTNVGAAHPYRAGTGQHDPPEAAGVLSLRAFNYKAFGPEPKLSKRDRMKAGVTPSNHAMAITGYDPGKQPGKVLKWKVDNSWGTKAGDKGHLHMYDGFFRQYVDTVVVPRAALPATVQGKVAKADARPPVNAKPPQRWSVKERKELVLQILRGELTVDQAAQRHNVSASTIERWHEDALTAMTRALRHARID